MMYLRPTSLCKENVKLLFLSYLLRNEAQNPYNELLFQNSSIYCCLLILRTDVCWVWFTVTLVYRNLHVTTTTIDCIHLWKSIWVLPWGKWADFSALYRVQIKFYKMICKNFMGFWEAPTIVGYYLLKFSNIHFPKSSKILFLEVLSIKWTKQLE